MLATNQGLLYVLSMVVIGGMVGGGSLGYIVVSGFSQDQLFGKGLAAGIAIAALGIMLDRIARYAAARGTADDAATGNRKARLRGTVAETRKGRSMARGPRRTAAALAVVARRGPRPDRLRRRRHRGAGNDDGRSGDDCGDLNIAINPWTGYVSNAHVDRAGGRGTSSAAPSTTPR